MTPARFALACLTALGAVRAAEVVAVLVAYRRINRKARG